MPEPLIPDTSCTSVEPLVAIKILLAFVGLLLFSACQLAAVFVPLGTAYIPVDALVVLVVNTVRFANVALSKSPVNTPLVARVIPVTPVSYTHLTLPTIYSV